MPESSDHCDQHPIQLSGVTGIILAGGKSHRYGRNKALADFDGVPLLERGIGVLRTLFRDLVIITNTPDEYARFGLPMFSDLIKGLGPLGGLYTGLRAIEDGWGFFAACDMPFLSRDLIQYIVGRRDGYDAVVPRVDWKIDALHALYGKACLPAIKTMIDARDFQIIKLFGKIRIKYVQEEDIRVFDPELKSFININRPQELSEALQLIKNLS
ncbi:MAG: molybdenum cofactor guanylyltransferase [Pseudomonadota bacterium]